MCKTSAERSARANREVPDVRHRIAQDSDALAHLARTLDVHMPCHGPDVQPAAVKPQSAQAVDAFQIDQRRRTCETHVHQRDQALSACEHFGVALVPLEQCKSFLKRRRTMVVKGRRFHLCTVKCHGLGRSPWVDGPGGAVYDVTMAADTRSYEERIAEGMRVRREVLGAEY